MSPRALPHTPGRILVTGASGNVGREVVRSLLARGLPVRKAVRTSADGGTSGDVAVLDFTAPTTWGPALDGCEALFLMRPPAIARMRDTLLPFLDAAHAAGVKRAVFLSVAGAGESRLVPHRAVEDHLRAGPLAHTILRPGFFAQNLQDAYLRDLREDDRLYVPAGDGRVAFVDVSDVAEVAAEALLHPDGHDRRAYTLTGPEALTFPDVAAILTEELGRPIRYERATVVGYLAHLRARSLPWTQALVQTALHVGLRFGQAEVTDPTLEGILGRPGRSLRVYVRAHAATWARRRDAPTRAAPA